MSNSGRFLHKLKKLMVIFLFKCSRFN